MFTSPLLKGGRVSSEDIVETYKYSEARRYYNLKEAYKDINAARELGVSDSKIENELKSRPGIKREIIDNLMEGIFTPQEPTEFFENRIGEITNELNRVENRSLPNPFINAERVIDKLIGKNSRISLADENLSLTDIDVPRQIFRSPLPDTPVQTPPLRTPMPAAPQPTTQLPSTQANTYASLFPRDELGNLIAQKKNI